MYESREQHVIHLVQLCKIEKATYPENYQIPEKLRAETILISNCSTDTTEKYFFF